MSDLKDIHFQVPLALWEDFYRAFPGRGERKAILIEFIKEAIRMQSHKNLFVETLRKNIENRDNYGKAD